VEGLVPPSGVGRALATVLERSRQLCLMLYEKEQLPTEESVDAMLLRSVCMRLWGWCAHMGCILT
jgi:hypothetical protein